MKKIRSLSLRLSLNILLFVSVLFIGALAVMAFANYKEIVEAAEEATKSKLHAMVRDIEAPLVGVEVSTQSAGKFAAAMIGDDKMLQRITEQLVRQDSMVCGSAVAFARGRHGDDRWYAPYSYLDADGTLHSIQLGHEGYDYYGMEWFRVPAETGQPHWSNPYYDDGGGQRLMTTYSYPMKDADGELIAVVTADVPVEWLREVLEKNKPYEKSFVTILCTDTTLLAYTNEMVAKGIIESMKSDTTVARLLGNMLRGIDSMVRNGKGRDASYTVYEPMRTGWSAAISVLYSEVVKDTNRIYSVLFYVGLVGLLVLFLLCYFIVRRVTRPIVDLSAAARNMSGGNLDVPLPEVKSRDEVLQLRDSFAYMQRSLTDYINELKTTTAANNRMEGELSVARDIQMGMLQSDFPPTLHAKLVPAKEVGGDLYDFMTLDDGTLYFAIGDVSGKGAPAALMMSITRAALRFVAGLGLDMAQAMSRVNDSIAEANSGDMFVTLFIGRLNPATGVMEYCNGGHNPIIVMGPDRHVRFLKAKPNLALGVMEGFRYEAERMQLEHGTRLLLYTDGVTEAERADKEQYGEGRLLAWAGNHSGETTEEAFVEGLYESVREYAGDNPQNDDITIMSIKY